MARVILALVVAVVAVAAVPPSALIGAAPAPLQAALMATETDLEKSVHAINHAEWHPHWLFVGGFHHSGTSLAELLIGHNPNLTMAFGAIHSPIQNEGQHVQRVFKTDQERSDSCTKSPGVAFCPSYFESLPTDRRTKEKLQSQWERYIEPKNAAVVVEKDPDFDSLLWKLQLFPKVSAALLVMRHPYTSHIHYGAKCENAASCLALFTSVWAYTTKKLADSHAPYAAVRYEAITDQSRVKTLIKLAQDLIPGNIDMVSAERGGRVDALGYRSDGSRGQGPVLDTSQMWAWVANDRMMISDAISKEAEEVVHRWSGYSLLRPRTGSASNLQVTLQTGELPAKILDILHTQLQDKDDKYFSKGSAQSWRAMVGTARNVTIA